MKHIALNLLLACLTLQVLKTSECGLVKDTEGTYWSHMNIVLEYPDPVTSIHGVAVGAGSEDVPVDSALVELFDHPEIALQTHGSQIRKGQKRLAACITGKDGRFSFDPPPGKYELRLSKLDCNVQSLIVTVSKRSRGKARIKVRMEAAT